EDRQRRTRDELHLALRPGGRRQAGERGSPQSPQDLADGRLVAGCLPAGDGPEEDSDLVLRAQHRGLLDSRSSTALKEKHLDGPQWLLALAASMSRITLSSRCCLPLPVGAIPTA